MNFFSSSEFLSSFSTKCSSHLCSPLYIIKVRIERFGIFPFASCRYLVLRSVLLVDYGRIWIYYSVWVYHHHVIIVSSNGVYSLESSSSEATKRYSTNKKFIFKTTVLLSLSEGSYTVWTFSRIVTSMCYGYFLLCLWVCCGCYCD